MRLWSASGILAVALLGSTAILAPPPPGAGAQPAEIVAYYSAHRSVVGAEALLYWIGAMSLLIFAARLLKRLWVGPLPLLGFGAAAVGTSLLLVEDGFFAALSLDRGQPGLEVILSDLQNLTLTLAFLPFATFLAATGWALRYCGARRLGNAGLVAAVLQLPSLATIVAPPGPLAAGGVLSVIAFASLLAWVLAASVTLAAIRGSAQANPAAGSAGGPEAS